MNLDIFLGREHNMETYNCWDFIRDVWLHLKKEDINNRTPTNLTLSSLKKAFKEQESLFYKLDKKESPSIVLFTRKKSLPHVGICLGDNVIHLAQNRVSLIEPLWLVGLGFDEINFYLCKKSM